MNKVILVASLVLFAMTSCGEKKKDVCTCMKESTQLMIDKGFEVDPEKPEYPEGCEYMSELSQDEINKQINDACREEIMKMIFGDFNFDETNLDETDLGLEDETPNDTIQ
jgi:hypothetical protein